MARRMTAVGVAALLGLAGCGAGSGEGARSSSSDGAATPSSSSSPPSSAGSPATSGGDYPIPEAATQRTRAGAKAFSEFYMRVLGEAQHRGTGDLIRAFSDPFCAKCEDMAVLADAFGSEGAKPEINPYNAINEAKVVDYSDRPIVSVRISIPDYAIVRDDGRVRDRVTASKAALAFGLTWSAGRWSVVDLAPTK